MDKTIRLRTSNDDSGGKAVIIIDDPSPRDTLRSLSVPPLCRRFCPPASPSRSRRRRGCDCGKTVSIFSPPGPVNWTDGKFPNEFIAFHRSVHVPYTVHGNLLYFILSKNDTSPPHLTRERHPLCYSSLRWFSKPSLSSSWPQLLSHGKTESDNIFMNVTRDECSQLRQGRELEIELCIVLLFL